MRKYDNIRAVEQGFSEGGETFKGHWVYQFKEWLIAKDFKKKDTMSEADIHSILFAFLNRTRLRYRQIYGFFTNCLCIRNLRHLRRDPHFREHFLFQKAEN